MPARGLRILPGIGLALLSRVAQACVTCDSATACQVRHGIFDGHFTHTLLVTAAPMPLLLAAAALVFFAFPVPSQLEAE